MPSDISVASFTILIVAIVLGGFSGAFIFFRAVEDSMRRVVYVSSFFVLTAIASVVAAIVGVILASLVFYSTMTAALRFMLEGFLWGVALYYISAARSNDIFGKTKHAWIGFIPIVNLYLMFKRGKSAKDPTLRQRSSLARYVGDPLLMIGAIVLASLANFIANTFDRLSALP